VNAMHVKSKLASIIIDYNVLYHIKPGPKKVQSSTRPCEVVVTHARRARGARAYTGSLGAQQQESRGQSPGGGQGGKAP